MISWLIFRGLVRLGCLCFVLAVWFGWLVFWWVFFWVCDDFWGLVIDGFLG